MRKRPQPRGHAHRRTSGGRYLTPLLVLALLLVTAPAWAAFPTHESSSTSQTTTASTSHTVTITTAAGHLGIIWICAENAGATDFSFTGWTELFDIDASDDTACAAAFRRLDGTEGTSVTVTSSASRETVHLFRRFSGVHASSDPEAATATAASGDPDPPSVTPSWGAEDTMWLIHGANRSTGANFLGLPANYTDAVESQNGGVAVNLTTGRRDLNAASENPGTINFSTDEIPYIASTIALRPAAAAAGGGSRCLLLC